MKKRNFSVIRIVWILQGVEEGRQVKDISHELEISDATHYNWKAKYGGMEATDIRWLKGARGGKCPTEADVCRPFLGEPGSEGHDRQVALGPTEKCPLLAIFKEERGLSEPCRSSAQDHRGMRHSCRKRCVS